MPIYRYQAIDAAQRPTAGEIDAPTVAEAIALLAAQGLEVQSIARAADSSPFAAMPVSLAFDPPPAFNSNSVSTALTQARGEARSLLADVFAQRQLVIPALHAYLEEQPASIQAELQEILGTLERGDLDRAVEHFDRQARWWLPLAAAVQGAATAGVLLNRFVARVEEPQQRPVRWATLLFYPLMLLVCVLGMLVVMCLVVVPQFAEVVDSFEVATPPSTTLLVFFSHWIRTWPALVVMVAVAAGTLALLAAARKPAFRQAIARTLLRLPARLTPNRLQWYWSSQLCTSLADALEAGVELPTALRVVALAPQRAATRQASCELASSMETNAPTDRARLAGRYSFTLGYALQETLPPAARVKLMRTLAECERERAATPGIFANALGPIAVLLMGLTVGWVMLALFQPLLSLLGVLS